MDDEHVKVIFVIFTYLFSLGVKRVVMFVIHPLKANQE